MDGQLQTPVVFIVFNRPTHTSRVFELIAQAKPQRLLIVADGPRLGKPGEDLLCEEVRRVASRIDWPCQLDTNYAAQNMGCSGRIVSGLNWVFSIVEEAIILEDDILPDLSFFRFCEEMLMRFRQDTRVCMITGFNIVQRDLHTNYSYFFSRLSHVWGWATWRRSWSRHGQDLRRWPEIKVSGLLQEVFDRQGEVDYWTAIFDKMFDGKNADMWDYQWEYANLIGNTVSVVPRVNLVENIGFGPGATHTVNAAQVPDVKRHAIGFPLVHPPSIVPLRSMDRRDLELSGKIVWRGRKRFVRKWKRTFERLWSRVKQSR